MWFYNVVWVILTVSWIKANVSISTVDFKALIDSQKSVIDNIGIYLKNHTRKLTLIRKYLRVYRKEQLGMEDADYFKNPINAYTLIKRLSVDLAFIQNISKMDTEFTIRNNDMKYPTDRDLDSAAVEVARVQDADDTKIEDLASGVLRDNVSSLISASDCFVLARAMYKRRELEIAVKWWKQALYEYNVRTPDEIYTFNDVGITKIIRNVYSEMDDIKNTMIWSKKLLMYNRKDSEAKQLIRKYKKRLDDEKSSG